MTNIICNECETVAHCMKNGCIPKQQVLNKMADNARELGLDYEQPAQRTWVGLTDEEMIVMSRYDLEYAALIGEVQRKLKEKNT